MSGSSAITAVSSADKPNKPYISVWMATVDVAVTNSIGQFTIQALPCTDMLSEMSSPSKLVYNSNIIFGLLPLGILLYFVGLISESLFFGQWLILALTNINEQIRF